MNLPDWALPLLALLLGGGGVWAIFRIGPERRQLIVKSDSVIVEAAKDVVVLQKETIESLHRDIVECRRRADDACEAVDRMEGQMRTLRNELTETRGQRDTVQLENTRLTGRVDALEAENAELKARVAELERREGRLESDLRNITPPGGNPAVEP